MMTFNSYEGGSDLIYPMGFEILTVHFCIVHLVTQSDSPHCSVSDKLEVVFRTKFALQANMWHMYMYIITIHLVLGSVHGAYYCFMESSIVTWKDPSFN